MLLKINPHNPPARGLHQVVEILRAGGIIIYPTDTVYGLGCDIRNKQAIEKIARLKGVDPHKAEFSCICADVSAVGRYTQGVDTPVFKIMKAALPGPYTFILNASGEVPNHFKSRRKTIGIRVVNHAIPTELTRLLQAPLLTTSLKQSDDFQPYPTEPEDIEEMYGKLVDAVINGGMGGMVPSTIIDCAGGIEKVQVVRQGLGPLEPLGLTLSE